MGKPPKKPLEGYDKFLKEINASLSKKYDGDKDLSEVLPVAEYKTYDSDNAQLKILEYQKIIQMRQDWSTLFKWVVGIILGFEIFLTLSVGSGVLKFNDEWFLRIIIVSGFAQILTMPLTITRFLFSNGSSKNS